MDHKEKSLNYFSQKMHCSQSVIAAFAEERLVSNKVNDLMMDRFKEKCGSYICNDLLGCDITTEEGHNYCLENKKFTEFCPKMDTAAVEIVEEIIAEERNEF